MTTEQMDILALKWANKNQDHCLQLTGTPLSERDYLRVKFDYFQGLKKANEIWQEKTRWIPVTERLPEVREEEYSILIKNKWGNVIYHTIKRDIDINYVSFTHWREIV